MACVRRRAGREAGPHGRADDVHDSRQGTFYDDRLEEQGLVREVDPDTEPRAAVSLAEVAAADPREQRDGAEPRVRAERAGPDGERYGPPAERAGDRGDDLPEGGEQGPDPRALDRGCRGGEPVRGVSPVQRPAGARPERRPEAAPPEGELADR